MIGDIIELKEGHLAIGKEIFEILKYKITIKK
jgi:uridine kinase